jgi:tetratricopeptide (TPR) repeat protein
MLFIIAGNATTSFGQKRKEDKTLKSEQNDRLAEEYFVEGNKEYILGRYDKALEWFERAYKLQPKNGAVNFKLAESYAQQNDTDKALELSIVAMEADPQNKYYAMLVAQLYERKKKFKDAIRIYEKIIKHSPGNDELLLNIANIQMFTGDYSQAIKTYERLESIYGINEEIVRQKQLLYLKENRLDDAIAEWRKLIAANPDDQSLLLDLANLLFVNNRNQEAKELLEQHVAKNPDSPFASLMLSEIYKKEGQKQKSDRELEKAFLSPQLGIDSKIGVIVSMLRSMQTDSTVKSEVIKLGGILLKVHPNDAKSYAMNGDILSMAERKEEALTNYEKSVMLDNSHYKIWQQVIFLASELNQNDTIIKYSEKAIEVFPTQPLFYYYCGSSLLIKKEYKEAVKMFTNGKKVVVNNNDLLVQFYSQMGDAYNSLKLFSKSDSCYEEALKLDPENVHVLNNYSYYLSLRRDKLERAKKMCEKMIQKSPDEPAYLDTYGWVLYQLKDYANAKKYIEKALAKTNDATIVEHYGDILFQLGEKDNAFAQWQKAKKGEGYSDLLDKKISERKLYE